MSQKNEAVEINPCVIKKLTIGHFRRFRNTEVNIGKNITLIAGQNGTSKSTLLGMLAQPFSFSKEKEITVYTSHYENIDISQYQTITGQKFKAVYSDIFRMSPSHDSVGDHLYYIHIEGPNLTGDWISKDGIPVKSEKRYPNKPGVRLVAGIYHNAGEGNFPHPVIYLGLSRLAPLAESKKLKLNSNCEVLNEKEKKWLHNSYKKILFIKDTPLGTDLINSGIPRKGDFLASSYADYNAESYSAGQDNLGQLLTALLSFKRLKKDLGKNYAGGVLLVDELDASLFAASQEELLKFLAKQSEELNLQIIATTHSTIMLNMAYNSNIQENIQGRRIKIDRIQEKEFTERRQK